VALVLYVVDLFVIYLCFICHPFVVFVAGQSLFIFVQLNLVGGKKKSVYYQLEFAAKRLQKCARSDQVQKIESLLHSGPGRIKHV
jgi:hypothetical protein